MDKQIEVRTIVACPCGSEPSLETTEKAGSLNWWHQVVCCDCGARGPFVEGCGTNYYGAAQNARYEVEAIDGWNTRHSALSTVNVDALREALERQMNEHDEEVQCLPSSVLRERGLVWLEGWFDLSAALSTKGPEASASKRLDGA